MGKINIPTGLVKRGAMWHIDKKIGKGRRLRGSTGTPDIKEAIRFLHRQLEQLRQAEVYGVRPSRTFEVAAVKYLQEENKRSLEKEGWALARIMPFIGDLAIENVHMGTLRPYIAHGRKQGWKNRTINMPMEVVRHILNLAASEWIDEYGMTWLQSAPKIRLLPRSDAQKPYPLSWEEQRRLFEVLPPHLRRMCLFAVNTGLRNREVCGLRWDDEVNVPELETSVFIIDGDRIKNAEDRLVVLNSTAKDVIDELRGEDPVWVFTYKGKPIRNMYRTAWRAGRKKAGLPEVRVHDLKHTFGRRLRAAGVSFEDRQALLGHKSGRITTHYSAPELMALISAAERVSEASVHKSPTVAMLRKKRRLKLASNY